MGESVHFPILLSELVMAVSGSEKDIGCMQWYTQSHTHTHTISGEIIDKLLLSSEVLRACKREQVSPTIRTTKYSECLWLCLYYKTH